MNDDRDFENKLLALTSALRRPDPTPAWKDEIIAHALREAPRKSPRRLLLPPRWLLVGWSAAWAAALVLHVSAPRSSTTSSAPSLAKARSSAQQPSTSLIAYNRQLSLNLDLP